MRGTGTLGRFWWGVAITIVVVVVIFVFLGRFPCKWTGNCQPCDGVPQPGAPIDITIGTENNIEYKIDGTMVTAFTGGSNLPAIFGKASSMLKLIETQNTMMVSAGGIVIRFDDGKEVHADWAAGSRVITWTCKDAFGNVSTLSPTAGYGSLPSCMDGKVDMANRFKSKSAVPFTGNWVHVDTDQ